MDFPSGGIVDVKLAHYTAGQIEGAIKSMNKPQGDYELKFDLTCVLEMTGDGSTDVKTATNVAYWKFKYVEGSASNPPSITSLSITVGTVKFT